ncbi:hypothetical protein L1987_50602 [Smallanthus sonchifolius]|uniref:Uncharacterized protein n=1 Tax=Smallanthus sonchifolius TaxID=185202 RepID=A0ACB9EP25_9ASTR|nr:hypothetical protein L1987_50602 [Smallanthus sonchifolius]
MTNSYSSSVTASQVGSYFVQQYYQVLQQQPEFAHQFYTGSSTMLRVDGESTETASSVFQIHALVQSLHFSGIEVKTINAVESWSDGIIVVVSGSVKSNCFMGWRKFVQTFFLAPQEKGYFVINDIFHFVSDEVTKHLPSLLATVHKDGFQPVKSSQNLSAVGDALEVEASEKFNSLHLGSRDQGDYYYTSHEHQIQQQEEDAEDSEDYEEESPVEQPSFNHADYFQETFYQNTVEYDQEPLHQNTSSYVQEPSQVVEKPAREPVKFTYASILQSNGKSMPSVPTQAPVVKSVPPTTEWNQPPEPVASFAPETTSHLTEDTSVNEEGESLSVYVRNLPTFVTSQEILQEFKNFGRIKQDGVFLKNRKDVGICFAFVEFEDISSVQKAIEASPIQLAGKQVYIEERRANSSSGARGGRGRGGRGRGSYDASRGRYGGVSNGRGNGFRN